jgi:cephalosporin-C deacetylase
MGVDRNYRCQVIKPEDFNEFWGLVLDELSSIELNVKCEKDELRSDSEVTVYQIFYDSLDHVRISGWYSVPNTPVNGLPAILLVPDYQSDPPIPKDWSTKGYACLSVNPRGKIRSRSQFDPGYPGLLTHRIADKNTYSYRGFYADAWRGIDFLLSRGEVESKRIGVAGSSQGGGLAITTSAMRKEIKAASAGAPYLCGFMDAIELTDTYPYQEINDYLRTYPDRLEEVENTLSYFDGISFADQIDCPIIMNLGLQDNVCPPETGYALFETIGSKDKKLFEYEGHGREAGRYVHSGIMDQFFDKHLKG